MNRILERPAFHPEKKRRTEELPFSKLEFKTTWRYFCEFTKPIKILTLLFLPEDYLWMFWHYFPDQPIYQEAYFSRYHIKPNCRAFKCGEGRVFKNLISLELAVEPSWYIYLSNNFNTFFPVLRNLSFLYHIVPNEASGLLTFLNHPTLQILRLKTYYKHRFTEVSEIFSTYFQENFEDWRAKSAKLKLVESSHRTWKISFCLSSGLQKIKPRRSDQWICIVHLEVFSDRLGSLDISLLPRGPNCYHLILVAKQFSNLDQLMRIGEKFRSLDKLDIYTSSIRMQGFHREVALQASFTYHIFPLEALKGTFSPLYNI